MTPKQKQALEDELAHDIMYLLMPKIKTGYHNDGHGHFLGCNIKFKFLNNAGGVLVKDLTFESELSDYTEN